MNCASSILSNKHIKLFANLVENLLFCAVGLDILINLVNVVQVQGQLVRIFEFDFDIIEIILKIELVKIDRFFDVVRF